MNNNNKPFIIPPDLVDLINFGQFKAEFEIPFVDTTNITGSAIVRIALLWEGDILEILRKSAQYTESGDTMTRNEFIALETLVYSIESLKGISYCDPDDKAKNEDLKNTLRMILIKFSDTLITYMYECYLDLARQRNKMLNEVIEPFKKKFQENLQNLTLNYKLI